MPKDNINPLFKPNNKAMESSTNEVKEAAKNASLEAEASALVNDAEGFKNAADSLAEGPVTRVNIEELDETTLLKFPIEAKNLSDLPMAIIKPKDKNMAFRWVFFDRGATGSRQKVSSENMQRYKFWGFQLATIEDIEGGSEALGNGMIDDGGCVTNYDTVLMKIDKVRLMAHYKSGLIKSMKNLDGAMRQAAKAAEGDLTQSGAYHKAMSTHPKAKIEFYSPVE